MVTSIVPAAPNHPRSKRPATSPKTGFSQLPDVRYKPPQTARIYAQAKAERHQFLRKAGTDPRRIAPGQLMGVYALRPPLSARPYSRLHKESLRSVDTWEHRSATRQQSLALQCAPMDSVADEDASRLTPHSWRSSTPPDAAFASQPPSHAANSSRYTSNSRQLTPRSWASSEHGSRTQTPAPVEQFNDMQQKVQQSMAEIDRMQQQVLALQQEQELAATEAQAQAAAVLRGASAGQADAAIDQADAALQVKATLVEVLRNKRSKLSAEKRRVAATRVAAMLADCLEESMENGLHSARSLFSSLDKNRDGSLSLKELFAALEDKITWEVPAYEVCDACRCLLS